VVSDVFRAVRMLMMFFWVLVPCRLIGGCRNVGIYLRVYTAPKTGRRSLIALMMEAASASETLINFYQTTRRYNPEDS
jgi:hypothetical protein